MGPKGKFIFIDDDKAEHIMFKRVLKRYCDNEVVSAYDGEEGLKVLKKHKDDIFLVICDVGMPIINGLELKRMIELTPELRVKAIPFVFHSSNESDVVIKEAYSLGIQGYIKKSVELTKSVKNLDILIKFWSTIAHPNTLKNE